MFEKFKERFITNRRVWREKDIELSPEFGELCALSIHSLLESFCTLMKN